MTTDARDALDQVQRDLAAWHAIHPDATLAEIETAVEGQVDRLRSQLLAARTEAGVCETHPVCRQCGDSMVPKTRSMRKLVLRGDQTLELERPYVVCPTCGAGLFPPG